MTAPTPSGGDAADVELAARALPTAEEFRRWMVAHRALLRECSEKEAEIERLRAALLAARRERDALRAALTRIRDEDSQSNHDPSYPGCHCAYCRASAALAATPEEK